MCISNPIGGGLIGNTRWKGVRLADLLKRAVPRKGVVDVSMTAVDGYTDSIPLEKAMDPDVVLVWEMDGKPLRSDHGFPARLLVPGIYGMKHVKWITSFNLVDNVVQRFLIRHPMIDKLVRIFAAIAQDRLDTRVVAQHGGWQWILAISGKDYRCIKSPAS